MPDEQSDLVRTRYDRGTAIAAVAIAGGWHITHNLLSMVAAWSDYQWPAVAAVAWIGYAVGVVLAGHACVSGRPLRGPWLWCAATLLMTAVVAAVTPDLLAPANWALGAAGWLAVLLLWRRPLWELVAFLILNAAASLGVLLLEGGADRVSLARYLVVIGGTVTLQLGLSGGTRALRAVAGWAAEAATAQARTVTAGRAAEAAHRDRLERYGAFQRSTATLLADLAEGRSDPADPAVRRDCALHAARLRRLLVERQDTPSPLLDELRACGDIAERTGAVVELSTVGDVPPLPAELRRALAEPAIAALTAARSHARVTVTATPEEIAVSVVADADPAMCHAPDTRAGIAVQWQHTGTDVWVEARVDRSFGRTG